MLAECVTFSLGTAQDIQIQVVRITSSPEHALDTAITDFSITLSEEVPGILIPMDGITTSLVGIQDAQILPDVTTISLDKPQVTTILLVVVISLEDTRPAPETLQDVIITSLGILPVT